MAEQMTESTKIAKETEEWAKKQKLLQMSEISLILDTYDDLFSDFDPRSLENRSLSDDFLMEIKRATKQNTGGIIEINFLIPLEQRKNEKEAKIKKRLHDHFRKHFEAIENDILDVRRTGGIMVAVGLALGIAGAVIFVPGGFSLNGGVELMQKVILVFIEPASWFTIWTGFEKIFATWKEMKPDRDFYKKMAKAEINFTGY
ncbi:MAG: hypothetical protein WCI04_04545 [archaeon]